MVGFVMTGFGAAGLLVRLERFCLVCSLPTTVKVSAKLAIITRLNKRDLICISRSSFIAALKIRLKQRCIQG
jgi:hypothetical protein